MRRLVGIALTALCCATAIVAVAGPAMACSCFAQTEPESLANADAVFIGTLVGYSPLDEYNRTSTWRVSEVFKGAVAAEQPVDTAADGAACGLEAVPGTTYLVFAASSTEPGIVAGYSAGLCGGTRPAVAGERPAGFPAPRAPGPGPPPSGSTPTTVRAPVTTRRSGATTSNPTVASTSTIGAPTTTSPLPPADSTTVSTNEPPSEIASSDNERVWPVVVLILVGAGIGGALWWRRRRKPFDPGGEPPPDDF